MSKITPSQSPAAGFGTVAYSHPAQETRSDGLWVLIHGSREQRREMIRQLKADARRGDPAAVELLAIVKEAMR